MKKLILVITFIFGNILYSQFKVVQNYPNNYRFNLTENAHQLTDGTSKIQSTAIWNDNSVNGFENIDLTKNFLIEAEYYLGYKDKEGADGIAFVLQTEGDDALGSVGVGMGFAMNKYDNNKAVKPSLGIELDTWYNDSKSPPAVDDNKEDHFAYVVNANLLNRIGRDISVKVDQNNFPLNIEDSTFHCVKFLWNAENKELSSYCDGQFRKSEKFDGAKNDLLDKILFNTSVYWGFTTGTATRDNIHMVRFDKLSRGNNACFVEIYENTPFDTTNPNCGFDQISMCVGKKESKVNLGLSTANIPIIDIVWKSRNGKSVINPVTLTKDKAEVLVSGNDIIDVIVYYNNGCSSEDSFLINTETFSIVNDYDTIYTCSSEFTLIDLDLIYNGQRIDNSSKVKWNWNNGLYIQDPTEYSDKEYINAKGKDTINFIITAEFTDDLGNICEDETYITVISETYYFDEEIKYSPCIDTAMITFQLFEDKNLIKKLNNEKVKTINWIPPASIDDFKDSKFPNSFDATVLTEGKYEIIVELESGCTIKISIIIDFDKEQFSLLPAFIELCSDDSVQITSSLEALKYKWSTGDSTKSIWINDAGTYKLEVESSQGCKFEDSILVSILPELSVNIIGDTTICKIGEFLDLAADGDFKQYLWSNSSKSNTIRINTPGKYWVKVTDNNGCVAFDTVDVVSYDSLYVRIEKDINFTCNVDTVDLKAFTNSQNSIYLWSNGSVNNSIKVSKEGTYWVEMIDTISGCIRQDTIFVDIVNGFYPELIGESTFCYGESTVLQVIGCDDCDYLWYDGSIKNQLEIDKDTDGFVIVSKSNQCIDTLMFEIKMHDLISPEIQGNLFICGIDSSMLFVDGEYSKITWSTGQKGKSIYIKESGDYTVEVEDNNGCIGYDTVEVEIININKFIEHDKLFDFGKIYLDSALKFKVNITNNYTSDIGIKYESNNKLISEVISNTKEIEFVIKPVKIGDYLDSTLVYIEYPCVDSFYIRIRGQVYTKLLLELPKITTYPGDSVIIPIYLSGRLDISSNYNFEMNFDKTILIINNSFLPVQYSGDVNLNNKRIKLEESKGLSLLTDSGKKPLVVDSMYWSNKFIETEIENGWIELLPVCNQDYRLIYSELSEILPSYNDKSNYLAIEKVGHLNNPNISIEIIDISGKQIYKSTINIEEKNSINLTELSAGVYFMYLTNNFNKSLYKFIKTN